MTTKSRPGLTVVIKLGTSSIIAPEYPFLPHLHLLSSIVETVVHLRQLGHRVVLVSSGAIGVGVRRMGMKERGKGLSHKQGRLIALWDNLFSQLDQPIAQILLTRMDISDRTRYLNAQNTFSELLSMGVVPIVNENDTVSVSEIKFGDNDTLSAISSNIVHADYLFLLTDVDCLYTDNPRTNPDAKPVLVVRDVEKVKQQVSTATLGTSLGTGGMSTKLIAAELATAAGVTTVIMHSEKVRDIFEIIEHGQAPSREVSETPNFSGPVCTRFLRQESALKDRKWWIAHGLHAAGTVVIDEGAYRAITKREIGGRLLPAGVVRVEGVFASHQAVRLVVRRKRRELLPLGAAGSAAPLSAPAPAAIHAHGSTSSLRFDGSVPPSPIRFARSPEPDTVPGTPTIQPALSLSSSIASLDPLSRTAPSSPAMHAVAERLAVTSLAALGVPQEGGSGDAGAGASTGLVAPQPLRVVQEVVIADVGEMPDWEEVEVGKGLAQYNSSEIDRIKGLKSAHIERIIGYCDSEHVVDSITLSAHGSS